MRQRRALAYMGYCIFCIILTQCMPDADRDNPFDPKAGGNRTDSGQLTGTVKRLYPPFEGIGGTLVSLSGTGGSTLTESDGSFDLQGIDPGQYIVTAVKNGFASDSTTVTIEAGISRNVEFSLDGLPIVVLGSVSSEHTVSLTTGDIYSFHFEVDVDDPDGLSDIDSVIVSVQALQFRKQLSLVISSNRYRLTASPDQIGSSLESIIGQEVIFSVWDRVEQRTDSSPHFLVRIIYQTPVTVTPNEEENMGVERLLNWESFQGNANYAFTYAVDVLSAFSSGWHEDDIPYDSTSIAVTGSLDPQSSHRWSIWVVDTFGNTSKSPYVEFIIEGGR